MNIFGSKSDNKQSKRPTAAMLPSVNSFISMVVPGFPMESIPVDEISIKSLVTRFLRMVSVGTKATFDYHNNNGHFRFTAVCSESNEIFTTFDVPDEIREITTFQPTDFALNALVKIRWRYAPDGIGYGDFVHDNLLSVSAMGATMILPREVRIGTLFEIQLNLDGKIPSYTKIGRLKSHKKVEIKSGHFAKPAIKSQGEIEFINDGCGDKVIADYINARQSNFFHRSLA